MTETDLAQFIGKDVVVDTDGPILYVGRLAEATPDRLVFEDVDVHYLSDGQNTGTKEIYIMDSKKLGVRSNRKSTHLFMARVMSISLLDDVVIF